MPGPPAARITDMHVCPMVTPGVPPIPHVGGPIMTGAPTVIVGKMPQARISDMCLCVGPPDVIIKGSATVLVCKMPAARIGDNCAHGGVIVMGFPTVMIGG
ncbi:type VI secretion protein [Roseomonas stagni]|uniref:Type VI secretion protein n=1 Tax=Falsiroseomonas algicola TaxID=2716930 RepID=A0A6M1LHS1_9PROT|nr:PAAR domain-containing protein [Falsiroseomonas algicola]NGM19856.1 type VI secretion protein [Falsiroseomonas algicola]